MERSPWGKTLEAMISGEGRVDWARASAAAAIMRLADKMTEAGMSALTLLMLSACGYCLARSAQITMAEHWRQAGPWALTALVLVWVGKRGWDLRLQCPWRAKLSAGAAALALGSCATGSSADPLAWMGAWTGALMAVLGLMALALKWMMQARPELAWADRMWGRAREELGEAQALGMRLPCAWPRNQAEPRERWAEQYVEQWSAREDEMPLEAPSRPDDLLWRALELARDKGWIKTPRRALASMSEAELENRALRWTPLGLGAAREKMGLAQACAPVREGAGSAKKASRI